MLGFNVKGFLDRCRDYVEQAERWSDQARLWAQIALTGVGVVEVPQTETELTVGRSNDAFKYFLVNNDLNTTTFFLRSDAVPGTSFQIRNNGMGVVQVQPLDNGIVNSSGTLILRARGSVVSLVCVRAANPEAGVVAMWDLLGDVQPL